MTEFDKLIGNTVLRRRKDLSFGLASAQDFVEAHEVWLIDTGHFIDMTVCNKAWSAEPRWHKRISERRVLRMFVPVEDLNKLPHLERNFTIVKRFFEVQDGVKKGRNINDLYRMLCSGLITEDQSVIKTVPPEDRKPEKKPEEKQSKKGKKDVEATQQPDSEG